jgi:hypothetical protein
MVGAESEWLLRQKEEENGCDGEREGTARFYRIGSGKDKVSVPVEDPVHYLYRGWDLRHFSHHEYKRCVKIMPMSEEEQAEHLSWLSVLDAGAMLGPDAVAGPLKRGRKANGKFYFDSRHPLAHHYKQVLTQKHGTNPGILPPFALP